MSEQWLAAFLAVLSPALRLSTVWLKTTEIRHPRWRRLQEQFFDRAAWPSRVARFFYFVGLPYFAVISGLLTTRALGLKGLEHFGLVGTGGLGVQQAAGLMLLEWLFDSGPALTAGLVGLALFAGLVGSLGRHGALFRSGPTPVWDTVYDSLHWTFYRAIFWTVTGDLYLGVVAGAALVLLEWRLVPPGPLRGGGELEMPGLSSPSEGGGDFEMPGTPPGSPAPASRPGLPEGGGERLAVKATILILTSTIFFYSPNWWLLLPVHLAMEGLAGRRWGWAANGPLPQNVA